MKCYTMRIFFMVMMILASPIATDSYTDITQLPPIVLENMTSHYYFEKGQTPSNIILHFDYLPARTNGDNRNYALMNSVPNVPLVSSTVAAALMNLTAEDWANGIYLVPLMVDPNGKFVTSYKELNSGADMYVALFDHKFNLLVQGRVSQAMQVARGDWAGGHPIPITGSPGLFTLNFSGLKLLHQEIAGAGSIFFIKGIDPKTESHLLTPKTNIASDASMYELPGSGASDIGAVSLPAGDLEQLSIQPTFGTAGTANLSLSSVSPANMDELSKHLKSGSVSIDFTVQPNDIGGYDAVLNAYQGGSTLFSQALTENGKGLLNKNGTMIPVTYTMSNLAVEYKTDGMNIARTAQLGLISEFVLVGTEDTVSSGKMLAKGELLTQLDAGYVFRMGYSQYTTIVPVPSEYIRQINKQLSQGIDVSFNIALQQGKSNYGVLMSAQAAGKQLFSRLVKDIPVIDGSTQQQTVMDNSAQVVIENIGYQTSNMTKGVLVPNSTTYSFMSNKLASIIDLSGQSDPISGKKTQSGGGSPAPTPASRPSSQPAAHPAPSPAPASGRGGFSGRF